MAGRPLRPALSSFVGRPGMDFDCKALGQVERTQMTKGEKHE